jgi:hypothetical protein
MARPTVIHFAESVPVPVAHRPDRLQLDASGAVGPGRVFAFALPATCAVIPAAVEGAAGPGYETGRSSSVRVPGGGARGSSLGRPGSANSCSRRAAPAAKGAGRCRAGRPPGTGRERRLGADGPRGALEGPTARVPEEMVLSCLLRSARAGLCFAERWACFVAGLPAEQVRVHCHLLCRAGKLEPVLRHGEMWFRAAGLLVGRDSVEPCLSPAQSSQGSTESHPTKTA